MNNKSSKTIAEHILSSSPAILYACRAQGDCGATFVSDNITPLLGYTRQECLESADFWERNIHPDDRQRVFSEFEQIFATGHHLHEYRFRCKSGDYLWILDEVRLIRDASGNPLEIVGSWLDITERKTMEDQLRENTRLKNEFIATASHELRTPLSAATGFTELLLQNNSFSASEREEFLSIVYDKLLVLERIIDELLDVNRIDSGRLICLDFSRINIADEIRQVVDQMNRESSQHNITCLFDDEQLELEVDRGKLVQVLENLLDNAIKFSPGGGDIQLLGNVINDAYQVIITDEGIGVASEGSEKIFELFYRADNSNTAPRGLGLGLHLAKNIITAHRGNIWVADNGGKGSRFHFTLPLQQDA